MDDSKVNHIKINKKRNKRKYTQFIMCTWGKVWKNDKFRKRMKEIQKERGKREKERVKIMCK